MVLGYNFTKSIVLAMIMFSITSAIISLSDTQINNMFSLTNSTMLQELGDEYNELNFGEKTLTYMRIGGEKLFYFGLFAQSLNNLVPTFRYDFPLLDKNVVGINDIPLFDGTDLFIILPLMALPWIILKNLHKKKKIHVIWVILILIFLAFISFLIAKQIYYQIYLHSASQIGLSKDAALLVRENFIDQTEASKIPLLIVSLFGGLAIAHSFIFKKKK